MTEESHPKKETTRRNPYVPAIANRQRRLTNKVRKKGQTRKGSIHEQVEDEFDEFEDIN